MSTTSPTEISSTAPDFGFLPGPAGLASLLTDEDGSASTRAGSHPNQLTINLGFPTEHSEEGPARSAGHVRDVITDLPQGLIANPTATPERCTELEFLSGEGAEPGCPNGSQIGDRHRDDRTLAGPTFVISHLYNMVPPPGAPAEVAFNALEVGIFIHLAGHVRSESDYGITTRTKTSSPAPTTRSSTCRPRSGATRRATATTRSAANAGSSPQTISCRRTAQSRPFDDAERLRGPARLLGPCRQLGGPGVFDRAKSLAT